MNKYYVYAAYGLEDELLYIGKGCGSRWKHCIYGASSSTDLNRYFFQNGEIGSIKVKIMQLFEKEQDALKFEMCSIATMNPKFNKNFNDPSVIKSKNLTDFEKLVIGLSVDYSRLMKQYIKAIENEDKDVIKMISEYSEEHKRHVDVLGVEKILALSCNKTKVSKLVEDLERLDDKYYDIVSKLSLKTGQRYTRKEIKEKLSGVYKSLSINKTAKASDIAEYYTVRDCYVNRVNRGYEIL